MYLLLQIKLSDQAENWVKITETLLFTRVVNEDW